MTACASGKAEKLPKLLQFVADNTYKEVINVWSFSWITVLFDICFTLFVVCSCERVVSVCLYLCVLFRECVCVCFGASVRACARVCVCGS